MKIHYSTYKTAEEIPPGWTPVRQCPLSGRWLAWQPRADRMPPLRRMIPNPQGEATQGPPDPDEDD